jgi:selenocysteine lyase/cysteine desulfurase
MSSPIGHMRATEFARLDRTGSVYLDYTGAALYPESLVKHHAAFLESAVLGNPHSDNPAATTSTELVESARSAVLDFFDADPAVYTVVFTANASAAFKLIGEAFPFAAGSRCVLTTDNHNSVNGIREYASRAGATVEYLPIDRELRLDRGLEGIPQATVASVFAFPAQSNFSGVKHPLDLVERYRCHGYRTVLDAAAFAPSNPLSLRSVSPDFVGVSFYKMFGYPTGIGALIAKKASLAELHRPWFAGGTVDFVSVQHGMHQLLMGPESFEDGTPNFTGVVAVPMGLHFLREVGMARVRDHVRALTERTLARLQELRHRNGRAAVRLYGPLDTEARGGTIAFNLVASDGTMRPYWEFEAAAAQAGISVRGGCFCNPGASEAAFAMEPARSLTCMRELGPGAFTPERFSACLGGAVGALRASFGIANVERDVDRFVEFVEVFSGCVSGARARGGSRKKAEA